MISNKQIVWMVEESRNGRQNAHKRALRKDAEAALNGDVTCREAMAARLNKEFSVQKSAVIVDRWRYRLDRIWAPEKGMVAFVMLNPSTADAEQDDATIRRCLGFAQGWGYGHLAVVNLYAYRATDPRDLKVAIERQRVAKEEGLSFDQMYAIGPGNAGHVTEVLASASRVIAAWGAHAEPGRALATMATFRAMKLEVGCFGWTKNGQPMHPLRQPKNAWVYRYCYPPDYYPGT